MSKPPPEHRPADNDPHRHQHTARRPAGLLTSLFAPAHLVIGLLLTVGAASHPSPMRGLAWGAVAALLIGVLPYAWVLRAVRTGRLASRHVPDRDQRLLPLGNVAAAAITGLAGLLPLGAPRQLAALVIAMLTGLAVTAAITTHWKISLHTAVAASTTTILTIVYGPALLTGYAVVAATGWTRIRIRDHTIPQLILGGLLGAAVAAALFLPLR